MRKGCFLAMKMTALQLNGSMCSLMSSHGRISGVLVLVSWSLDLSRDWERRSFSRIEDQLYLVLLLRLVDWLQSKVLFVEIFPSESCLFAIFISLVRDYLDFSSIS
ncbi:hypothetical protein M5K25_016605 [Dendrobium thyrsiflorum]|uniref:Uncharacterized protein n=1 Tax=Dendrobium thyrsiflorum TaxID=117978 RepID=A0ABD0USC5_DENTH